jgi:hypothetical protein
MNIKNQIIIKRQDLFNSVPDMGGRDIIIGFNEPAFRKSDSKLTFNDLDAKLNARLPAYFLPAVQIAQSQTQRPRFIIVSAIFAALRWNAVNETERRIMLVNNNLKIDFIRAFFNEFFVDTFSIVEFRQSYDFLKISDHKLELLWNYLEKKYPEKLQLVTQKLIQYKNPKLFSKGVPSSKILAEYSTNNEQDLKTAFYYTLVHLFALADINIGWDFAHNPKGYCSIGEHQEMTFNIIRDIGFEVLKEVGDIIFDQPVYSFENLKIVIEDEVNFPPAYNGASRKSGHKQWLDEVTYENDEALDYYNSRPKLKPSMDYLYQLVDQRSYEQFWNNYRNRYFEFKERYKEAYGITIEF